MTGKLGDFSRYLESNLLRVTRFGLNIRNPYLETRNIFLLTANVH